jgi:WD40-like Beta Propeller Repeat
MRIIRNFLILCVLMCGLLFGAQQFSAGIGKRDMAFYSACTDKCIPTILDMRTMIRMALDRQDMPSGYSNAFWTENGNLYLMDYNLYQWDSGNFYNRGSFQTNDVYLIHNENNVLAFTLRTAMGWKLRLWDGRWWVELETILPEGCTSLWAADGRFACGSTDIKGNREGYIWDGRKFIGLGQISSVPNWSADGRLTFSSDRDGNREIYVWDGTTLTNISQHAANDYNPAWSSDGRLAFISERDGNSEIYVWDGEILTNVSQTPQADHSPIWNESGQLAFVSERDKAYIWEKGRLHLIELTGIDTITDIQWLSQRRLLFNSNRVWDDGVIVQFSAYFPNIIEYGDGGIAFISAEYRTDGQSELYVVDGEHVIGTGLVGRWVEFKSDGKGGLAGSVCGGNPVSCDLYGWKDGHAYQITNTPSISEQGPIFRP